MCGRPDSGSVSSPSRMARAWRAAQASGTDQSIPRTQFHAAYFFLPYSNTRAASRQRLLIAVSASMMCSPSPVVWNSPSADSEKWSESISGSPKAPGMVDPAIIVSGISERSGLLSLNRAPVPRAVPLILPTDISASSGPHFGYVLRAVSDAQVRRVNATRVVAGVEHPLAFRDGPHPRLIGKPVGQHPLSV